MRYPLPKLISILLVGFGTVLLALKIMTAVVFFSDDPTTLLVVKSMPSWSNFLQDAEPSQYWIKLLSDENGFVGFTFYQLLVEHFTTIFLILALLLGGIFKFSRRALTKSHAN